MWKISPQSFGFVLTFSGRIEPDEMRDWVSEARRQLHGTLPAGWGVVVDMRELEPLSAAAQAVMVEGQKAFKQRGMQRSAVALKDAVTTMQFRRLARESGIDAWERYLNVQQLPAWQSAAKHWVVDGTEPPV
jgi:anti-anti-sigma regulatory factor